MTRQFKFGDRIRNALVPNLTFIYLRKDSPTTCICLDETTQEKRMIATDMELVPHPDTVRLDWLVKNDCALTERLCDEDGDRLDTPFAVIQKQEEHFEVLAAACDIREAIDAAMWESKNEAH